MKYGLRFYLGPRGCKNGDDCQYGHEYKLNAAQLDELARLAKCIMCPYVKDGRCRYSDDECVYGHQCPNPEKCVLYVLLFCLHGLRGRSLTAGYLAARLVDFTSCPTDMAN